MSKRKKKLVTIGIIIFLVLVFKYFFIIKPALEVKAKGMVVAAAAKEVKAAFLQNDIDLVRAKFKDLNTKYDDFGKSASGLYWAAFIPYISDFKNGVEAGHYLMNAGKESIDAVYPYADLIGFKKGQASFTEQSAENRLQTAIITLDKVLSKVDVVSENINEAEKRINTINPDRYPEKIGNTVVRARIINLKEQFLGVATLFVDAKPLLKNIPEIFGKNKEKTYLLLFQNEYEQRATGGFLTAYGAFKIREGKIRIERSEDIYSLDNSIGVHPPAPEKIIAYHKNVNQFYIRDSNLSPDFIESMKLFDSLYQKGNVRIAYDGVIALDAKVLVDMLTIFGDTEAGGVVFSARKDVHCDCPQVIYQLFDMVDRPVGYVKTNRKGILGDLMYALFYKAIGFSPSKYWGTLAQTMFKNLDEKHILLSFTDPQLQSSIEKLNYAGRIRNYEGDYLHVNNVNFAGAKSNLFVTQTLISKTDTNTGERTVIVEFKNPHPHSDCRLETGGLCLNAILRNWIRVYVPKGSKLKKFEGSKTKVLTYEDLGKTVFEGFLEVSPQGKAEVHVTYAVPKSVDAKKLLIQDQPATETNKLKVYIDNSKLYDGLFDRDKEFKKP